MINSATINFGTNNGEHFTIYNINRDVNKAFIGFYNKFIIGHNPINDEFINTANGYLDKIINDKQILCEDFLTNFNPLSMHFMVGNKNGKCIKIWELVIDIIEQWEKSRGKNIHKGTPYYFLGTALIRMGYKHCGITLMQQAYEEDIKNSGGHEKELPAYKVLNKYNVK